MKAFKSLHSQRLIFFYWKYICNVTKNFNSGTFVHVCSKKQQLFHLKLTIQIKIRAIALKQKHQVVRMLVTPDNLNAVLITIWKK